MNPGPTMIALGKITRFAGVHLTAVLLLAAGLPHLECRCASGHRQPFCLALFAPSLGGCVEPCCAAPAASPERTARRAAPAGPEGAACCCCKQAPPKVAKPSRHPNGVKPRPCRKDVAPAKAWSASSHQTQVAADSQAQAVLPINDCLPAPSSGASAEPGHRYRHWHGPPVNLATLQRLVI
jgi:hypothetical protein